MKKQFALVILLFVLSLSGSTRAFAQSGDESEIRAIDEKLRVAFLTKDAKTLESLYATDFYFVNALGEVTTRAEFLKNNLDENYVFKSLAYNDEKVYSGKNTALSTYSLERQATYKNADNSGKFRATRLYVKRDGKWQVVYQQTTEATQTANAENSNSETAKLNKMFEDYFEERLKLFPLEATQIADSRYNDKLPDSLGDAERAKQLELFTKYKTQLSLIESSQLTGNERLSYDIFKSEMTRNSDALNLFDIQEFPVDHFTPINQFAGLQLTFAQLGSGQGNQPFKTVKDYENFLGRINGFQIWINTAIANMRKGIAAGIVQPKVLMERTLPQYQELIAKDATKSIFYQPIQNFPADFSEADKTRLAAAYVKAIETQINPTYQKLYDFVKNEYLPKCRPTSGLSTVPNGKERYAFLVKYYTTTNLTPDEIHQIGLSEVARIKGEMEKVKAQVNFKGDLKAFFDYIRTDAKFRPFKTPEDVLNSYRSIESRLQANVPKYFGITPKSKFEIRQTEKFREASASEEYSSPAPDGSRPGVFYVPIPDATQYGSPDMESTFLHEAIPGHHFQISLQQENESLPKFRKYLWYNAYGEGWALYTESLGKELGIYTDPYQYFGMLTNEMHRAIRLVVDTGIHSKGWTREEAIKYSLENEGASEENITREIERYMAIPGQALSYKIGQLKIIEMRRKAEKSLGAKFDIRAFHDETLKDGVLPLDVYEAKMNAWILRQQTAK